MRPIQHDTYTDRMNILAMIDNVTPPDGEFPQRAYRHVVHSGRIICVRDDRSPGSQGYTHPDIAKCYRQPCRLNLGTGM
jgi:hypothetical protein